MSTSAVSPARSEVFNACLGEMYRYRLAVRDQNARVAKAIEDLRARRDEIEAAIADLIFAAEWTEEWFREQHALLSREDIPDVWRLKTEGQFLLTAIRGVYMMARTLRDKSDPQTSSALAKAVQQFESQVPDAMLLRNIHEHLEEYVAGGGRQKDKLPSPFTESAAGMLDEELAYFLGGKLFLLWEISAACRGAGGCCRYLYEGPLLGVGSQDLVEHRGGLSLKDWNNVSVRVQRDRQGNNLGVCASGGGPSLQSLRWR